MADHPMTFSLFYDGVWNDVTGDVSQGDGVTITHGGGEVSDAPKPSSVTFTFEDPDGTYRPYSPTSPLYGKAGRNTPLLVGDGGTFEVASWSPDQTLGFNQALSKGRRWTDVSAQGLLRRVGSWTEPLASSMTRALTRLTTLTDLWTFEDARDAAALANPYGTDGTYRNNGLGDAETPGGGSTSFKLGSGAAMDGVFSNSGSLTSWQVSVAFRLVAKPTSASYEWILSWGTNADYVWVVSANNANYQLEVFDPTGSNVLTTAGIYDDTDRPDQWINLRVQGSVSGGTVSYGLGWFPEGDVQRGISGTFAGSLGRPNIWSIFANPWTQDGWFNYLAVTSGQTEDLLDDTLSVAFAGHDAETTGDRFLRLLDEENLTATVDGDSDELMGPQRPDTLLNHLKEIRDTDGGYLVDDHTQIGLFLRSRKSMYAQTAALALTYGLNVAPPLKPILDDLNTHNVITVSGRNGGVATVEDSTSAMGSADPPAGVGKAKQDIAVNVHNTDRLTDIAYWWLNLGTLPDARYASVTVDLDANPELETAAAAVRAGDRITVTSLDPDRIDLLVIATTDKHTTQKRRTITFTCAPYRQFDVGIYDDTTKRYDSATSTTNATSTTTAATIVVKFTDLRDAWSTTNAPYDWVIAGERIRVTAMGAITGSGPWTQSATVTRSVNGVVKAHAAGEPIHMHPDQQARYAL